jgi:hypothetical protein
VTPTSSDCDHRIGDEASRHKQTDHKPARSKVNWLLPTGGVIASRNTLRRLEISLGLIRSEPEILRPGPSKLAHDGAKAAVMSTVGAFRGEANHGEEITAPHAPFWLAVRVDRLDDVAAGIWSCFEVPKPVLSGIADQRGALSGLDGLLVRF